jgi:hypothetical protein
MDQDELVLDVCDVLLLKNDLAARGNASEKRAQGIMASVGS